MRARTSASRPTRYWGAANATTASETESTGGAWYSRKPIWPIVAGSDATSTAPALNT